MTLADLKANYEARSLKAGDIVRQLDLAGIAIIWVFKVSVAASLAIEPKLLLAAILIFASLSFDLAQYLLGTLMLFSYFRYKERMGTTEEQNFDLPAWLPLPMWICFWLKSGLVLAAYLGFIMPFLIGRFIISMPIKP